MGAAALVLVLAGCASGSSGTVLFNPPPPSGYTLTHIEHTWNCGGLTNAIQARVTRIVALQTQIKREGETMAPTVTRVFTRLMSGPGSDSPALAQIPLERAAADAYNAELKSKGCPVLDIDAKVAAAAATAAAAAKPEDTRLAVPKTFAIPGARQPN